MGKIPGMMKQLNVQVEVRRSINNFDDPRTIAIVFTDEASRKQIGEARLTPEEFGLAITGSMAQRIPAEFLADEHYRHLGRTTWHATIVIKRGFDGQGFKDDDLRLYEVVSTWANAAFTGAGFRVGIQNNGLALSVRGYSHSPDAAALDAATAGEALQSYVIAHNLPSVSGVSMFPTEASIRRDRELEEERG